MDKFHHILNALETVDEFETKWAKWTLEYKVQDNKWLEYMFQIRKKWCPVYVMDLLFIGMQSTQQSKGMNALVKTKVKRCSTL